MVLAELLRRSPRSSSPGTTLCGADVSSAASGSSRSRSPLESGGLQPAALPSDCADSVDELGQVGRRRVTSRGGEAVHEPDHAS